MKSSWSHHEVIINLSWSHHEESEAKWWRLCALDKLVLEGWTNKLIIYTYEIFEIIDPWESSLNSNLIGQLSQRSIFSQVHFLTGQFSHGSITRPEKLIRLFCFLLLEALKFDLQIKVGWVFKKSGKSLHNGHWDYPFWTERAEKTRFEFACPT